MTREEFLDAWASLGRSPNTEQLAIMDHGDGPLQIIAGPGVGKTYALALRVCFLLCVQEVPPQAIVVTTFTRKAAEELRYRLQETLVRLTIQFPHLKTIDLSRMHLGTLHSICYDILTQTPGSRFRHLQLLGALERAFFIRTTSSFGKNTQTSEQEEIQLACWIDKKQYRSRPSRWQWVRTFTTAYERLANDQIDRSRFADASPLYKKLIECVEEYELALRERHFTDPTLLQQQALDLLLSLEGAVWRQDIKYVFVDEYQDTNMLQAKIYRALAAAPPHNLCVVGDDDQALYRFRGGTVSCLVHFAEECQQMWTGCEVSQLALLENYRSQPAIVNWYNHIISIHPQMSLPFARIAEKAPVRAQSPLRLIEPAVWAIRGKTLKESAENFVTALRLLKEEGVIESYADCVLLAHSFKGKTAGSAYVNELQQQGIPIVGRSLQKEQKVYKQILGTLFLILDPSKNLLPGHFSTENAAYVEECRQSAQAELVLGQMARQVTRWLLTEEKAASSMSLTKLAQRILNAAPCITAIEHDPDAEVAAQMLIQTLDAYDRIVEKGYHIPLEERPGIAGKKRVARWWMERLYYVLVEGVQQEHLERGEERVSQLPDDMLSLLTIHRAKGLEFPVVAVVAEKQNHVSAKSEHQLERDLYPFRQDVTEEQTQNVDLLLGGTDSERAIQDLVRLHYVAYSRPQSVLLLLITDEHLEQPTLALSLGIDREQFREYIEVWPPKQKKGRSAKKQDKATSQQGAEQYGLWNDSSSR